MEEQVSSNHPFQKLRHKPKKWAKQATDRMKEKGTVGSLTRLASAHGEKPMQFAREHYSSPGNVGAKSRFAVNINK